MNIQDALKINGRATHSVARNGEYAEVNTGVLHWFNKNGLRQHPVSMVWVIDDTWQPYHSEPQCPACIVADESETYFKVLLGEEGWKKLHDLGLTHAQHLRNFHCTCEGGG